VGAFGEKLRKQREQRGIELDAISNTTKISTRMLRAIEEEHFDQLPGGVFNKGFVRAYARQVGLDEEEAVADYLAALRESQIQAQTVPPNFRAQAGKPAPEVHEPERRNHDPRRNDPPRPDLHKNEPFKSDPRKKDLGHNGRPSELRHQENSKTVAGRKPERGRPDRRKEDRRNQARSNDPRVSESPAPHSTTQRHQPNYPEQIAAPLADNSAALVPWGKLAAALLLLTLALAVWSLLRRGQPTPASQTHASSHPSPPPGPAPAPARAQPSASSASLTAGKALSTGNLTAAGTPVPKTAPTLADATALKPSQAPPSLPSSTNKPAANSGDSDDNAPVAKSSAPAPVANAPPTFSLLIRATETSWVSVVADGQPLLRETLIAPAHTSVRATREIVVRAGNAAGISFLLNGKEIPASGNEAEGEVRTYTFDSTGMKASTAAQTPDPAR
jgi:hypothetical protein